MINPRFASPNSLSLVLQQVAVIGALAVGQTLIILTAGIDLSVGAITILAMMVAAKLAEGSGIPGVARRRSSASALGVAAGALNGALVTRLKPAAVHRHARHAEHLHRDRAALLQGPERAGRRPAGPAELDRRDVRDRPVPDHHRRRARRRAVRRGRLRAGQHRLGPARLRRRRRQGGRPAGRHPGRPGAAQRLRRWPARSTA